MGLMTSKLLLFRATSILCQFMVPKLILLFTTAGWSGQTYSINVGAMAVLQDGKMLSELLVLRACDRIEDA